MNYKKTLRHPKADEEKQCAHQEKIKTYQEQKRVIVYLDESGFAHDMPRTHGYAPIGQRCYGLKNWHAKERTNLIGALIDKTLLTVGLFTTNINADIFYCWVTQDQNFQLPVLLSWIMRPFINVRILRMSSSMLATRLNICLLIPLILTILNTNGFRLKPPDDAKALLSSCFLPPTLFNHFYLI